MKHPSDGEIGNTVADEVLNRQVQANAQIALIRIYDELWLRKVDMEMASVPCRRNLFICRVALIASGICLECDQIDWAC